MRFSKINHVTSLNLTAWTSDVQKYASSGVKATSVLWSLLVVASLHFTPFYPNRLLKPSLHKNTLNLSPPLPQPLTPVL